MYLQVSQAWQPCLLPNSEIFCQLETPLKKPIDSLSCGYLHIGWDTTNIISATVSHLLRRKISFIFSAANWTKTCISLCAEVVLHLWIVGTHLHQHVEIHYTLNERNFCLLEIKTKTTTTMKPLRSARSFRHSSHG